MSHCSGRRRRCAMGSRLGARQGSARPALCRCLPMATRTPLLRRYSLRSRKWGRGRCGCYVVIPAQAGIYVPTGSATEEWVLAFAGTTDRAKEDAMALVPLATKGHYFHVYDFKV